MIDKTRPIRVKILSRLPTAYWLHQLPHGAPRWGNCEFIFDQQVREYDWLVAYDDIPALPGENRQRAHEILACPQQHTLLVTTEPSSIKIYGDDYTRQFGAVLTSQAAWALPHPQRLYSQPALHWFYGLGSRQIIPFDDLLESPPTTKTKMLSMVFSAKSMRHTLHYRRAALMRKLIDKLPEMDAFGRAAPHALDDKADSLRAYRYHIAIENFIGEHHWTEKLADPFLGLALPFYAGCPNASAYFPAQSFIPIDIRDAKSTLYIIQKAIAENEYENACQQFLKRGEKCYSNTIFLQWWRAKFYAAMSLRRRYYWGLKSCRATRCA